MGLTDVLDKYKKSPLKRITAKSTMQFYVLRVLDDKKADLSLRPSRLSDEPVDVVDLEITSIDDIAEEQIVRGFIKNTTDEGSFVSLVSGKMSLIEYLLLPVGWQLGGSCQDRSAIRSVHQGL